ncbi:MAG: hypothetical protein UY50_C0036G0003 [Parcubacteria group bacterium GW2011_GWA2_49_9]|nr:MAG: hypothetical protein UY50_C0036G0003 [Parcubacteria group bacterium GW2011_GWA2_49_9]
MKTQKILVKIFGDTDGNGQKDGPFSDGNIPNTNWSDKFYLNNGYHPDNANPNLRARVEVSRTKGASRSFLRIAYPAVCFFGYPDELFGKSQVRLLLCHAKFVFGADEMFQYLYLYP